MNFTYRVWRYARYQVLLHLGLIQGGAFRSRPQERVTARRHPLETEYRVLGAPSGADLVTVRTCWRLAVRRCHPDRFHHDPTAAAKAAAELRAVNLAYQRLTQHLGG